MSTLVHTSTSTSTAPSGRSLWRQSRGPLAAFGAIALVAIVAGGLRATGAAGLLDPRAYDPSGSRALATLLADRGAPVRVVGDLPQLRAALQPGSTVLVPSPQSLTPGELRDIAGLGAPLVVTGAGPAEVEALGLPVDVGAAGLAVRQPTCDLPVAVAAGPALAGRVTYDPRPGVEAVGCYATGGHSTLLALPRQRIVLVGAPDILTNDKLDTEGDAALALGLLGNGNDVLWLLPNAGRSVAGAQRSVRELLPDGILLGALQVAIAIVVLALWRSRRLGRVVVEPLPVVVRAAEAVEGRSRLYRAAGARGAAGEALRAGARDRLVRRLGLPVDADRAALVTALSTRAGLDPATIDGLLYGAPPRDDAALVRLADALDSLTT